MPPLNFKKIEKAFGIEVIETRSVHYKASTCNNILINVHTNRKAEPLGVAEAEPLSKNYTQILLAKISSSAADRRQDSCPYDIH